LPFYERIAYSVLTRSSQSASFTNTRMPGLLQTESYSHRSILLRKPKRMLTNTQVKGRFLLFTGHNVQTNSMEKRPS
jgi:hypothetical protein